MQLDTLVKVGSLAFEIAQDERVRELVTMVHQGAKRRGFPFPGAWPPSGAFPPAASSASAPPKPAQAPQSAASVTAAKPQPEATKVPSGVPELALPTLDVSRWLNRKTAYQAMDVATRIGRLLVR
ncbi:MAG: hypothetical protein K6T63_06045 [Alicyclobacillus herbarius]|uniref:hypothetical protein n=1 Tax=Alicyclobacillus herbarius TaxID=122960 RepID=UPI0023554286|nr:hypothetical protein [Alicyclobacillus herbarius]MCL6632181.1 hypothetical protein [Alicyclobacillus herbarius]